MGLNEAQRVALTEWFAVTTAPLTALEPKAAQEVWSAALLDAPPGVSVAGLEDPNVLLVVERLCGLQAHPCAADGKVVPLGLDMEAIGVLALTVRNDHSTPPVQREDVVAYLRDRMEAELARVRDQLQHEEELTARRHALMAQAEGLDRAELLRRLEAAYTVADTAGAAEKWERAGAAQLRQVVETYNVRRAHEEAPRYLESVPAGDYGSSTGHDTFPGFEVSAVSQLMVSPRQGSDRGFFGRAYKMKFDGVLGRDFEGNMRDSRKFSTTQLLSNSVNLVPRPSATPRKSSMNPRRIAVGLP
uniref:Uncharacterized protein n=1 Tax=Eutreptiella gymnastica TaxID=73025 RepID=A0A7S4GHF3_9EUGL